MKKIVIAILLLSLGSFLPGAGDKFFASIGAAALAPADAHYKSLYGDVQFSPELRLGYNLYRNFYFWLGGSFFSASGTIPVLEEKIKATQMFLSLGAGWETRRTRRLQADLSAALIMAGFREKALGATVSKWAPGFDARAGLRYFLRDNLFVGITLGYAGAWTAVKINDREKDIVLGGLRLGGLLGFRF